MSITIVAISDTHGHHRSLSIPSGDILVHAGDFTRHGEISMVEDFNDFLASLPHRHKIVIAGNHDFCFQEDPTRAASWLSNATYLMDEAVTVEGIRFWGSPWQPWFFDWAFNLQRGAEIRAKWDLIPLQTDVLVTHGPPVGHGDLTSRGDAAGCEDLMEVVRHVRPRLHIFGHIHEGYGVTEEDGIAFFNASSCNLGDNPVNPPLVYHYET